MPRVTGRRYGSRAASSRAIGPVGECRWYPIAGTTAVLHIHRIGRAFPAGQNAGGDRAGLRIVSHNVSDPSSVTTSGSTPRVRIWRVIVALLAVAQLVTPAITARLAGDFLKSGATNDAVITPSGYAFSMWGLICVLCVATAAGVLWRGLGAQWEMRLLTEASVVFIGFSVWLVFAANNWLWFTVVVFVVMVAALTDMMWLLVRHRDDLRCPRWLAMLAALTFGLYLGWSSIAVFVNVAAALIDTGWSPTATLWQALILLTATTTAVALTVLLRSTPGYVAGVLWALIAAALGAAHRGSPTLAAASAVGAVLVVVTSLATAGRRRRGVGA